MQTNIVKKRNFGLDAARAAAILLVLSNHLIFNTLAIPVWVYWYLAKLGVDIFFALSGFLIGHILLQVFSTPQSSYKKAIRSFFARRFLRTMPLYFIMLLINYLLAVYLLKGPVYISWKYFFFLQNFNTLTPPFFGESWSLTIEEWFYISFTLGMWLVVTLSSGIKAFARNFIIFTLAYILVITFLRIYIANGVYSEATILLCRLDAIAYGVLAAFIDRQLNTNRFNYAIGISGFLLAVIGIVLYMVPSKSGGFYILYYNIAGPGLALCVLFCKRVVVCSKAWLSKPVTFTSKISYSLYLLNLPVLYFFKAATPSVTGYLLLLVCTVTTFILSYISWKFIEQPFLRLRRSSISLPK